MGVLKLEPPSKCSQTTEIVLVPGKLLRVHIQST